MTTATAARSIPRLHELHDVLLASILGFLAPRDLEAVTVVSKTISRDVLPRFPIWKQLFCYRWNMLNFPLQRGANDEEVSIEIDPRLRAMFPR
jgi:hypothetical protein